MKAGSRVTWVLFALLEAGAAYALDPSRVFEKVSPSVWMVRTFDANDRPISLGSGVVVGPGKVVTNCHVLAKATAVVVRRKGNFVYRVNAESMAERVTVKLGEGSGNRVAVDGALKAGERIVVRGADRLEDGQKVRTQGSG